MISFVLFLLGQVDSNVKLAKKVKHSQHELVGHSMIHHKNKQQEELEHHIDLAGRSHKFWLVF